VPVNGGLDAICHAELPKNARDMVLGGTWADAQLRRDFVVVQTTRHELEYLQLAGRELRSRRFGAWPIFQMVSSHPVQDRLGCSWRKPGGPRHRCSDRSDHIVDRSILDHVSGCPCRYRRCDIRLTCRYGQRDHPRRWVGRDDLAGRFQPVYVRHPEIHQNDIWSQFGGETYGHPPTGSLCNDFDALVFGKRGGQANSK